VLAYCVLVTINVGRAYRGLTYLSSTRRILSFDRSSQDNCIPGGGGGEILVDSRVSC
jgi:hypothetical protein